ncbi:MAG: hypothetical protein ACM3ML_36815 [Micromonosporaceae bacterium]
MRAYEPAWISAPQVLQWLARQFAPDRVEATTGSLTAAQDDPGAEQQIVVQAGRSSATARPGWPTTRPPPAPGQTSKG